MADLRSAPAAVVGPAGAAAALLGTLQAVRTRWPETRGIALVAADVELPELPLRTEMPGFELRRVSFTEASRARDELEFGGHQPLLMVPRSSARMPPGLATTVLWCTEASA